MFDWEAHSNCGSENIIYRLFWMYLKWKTKEEAIEDILEDDKPNDLDTPKEDE